MLETVLLFIMAVFGIAIGAAALVMATRRHVQPDAYVTMERAYQMQQERNERLAMRLEAVEKRLRHLEEGVLLLIEQVRTAKMDPVWTPDGWETRQKPQNMTELRQVLEDKFSIDELDTLAFDLGINPDQLSGETLDSRARSLVNYAKRRGLTDRLMELVAKERPQ